MGVAQAATAFPLRLMPLLAPLLLAQAGAPLSAVGYLSSVAMLGAMVGSLATGVLCARLGSLRCLQLAMGVATASALLHGIPNWVAFAAASLLAGLADGVTPAAGNSLLQRAADLREQQRLFAIKMIGAPLGGLAVGLVLPRVASDSSTWHAPLVAATVTATAGLLLAASGVRWPDDRPGKGRPSGAARTAGTGIMLLARLGHLRRIAALGFFLAFSQGVWYAYFVVFLVTEGGVTLVRAGTLMSVALAAGILMRLTLGWAAHRLARPDRLLGAVCLGSAVPWIALAVSDASDGVWVGVMMALAFGATLGGWLGVQQAEIARSTPPEYVDRVSGAAAFLMFLALTLSGVCFALLTEALNGSRPGFLILGIAAALVGALSLLNPSERMPGSTDEIQQNY
jgi:predicted MFS family arabinose efflux permease